MAYEHLTSSKNQACFHKNTNCLVPSLGVAESVRVMQINDLRSKVDSKTQYFIVSGLLHSYKVMLM